MSISSANSRENMPLDKTSLNREKAIAYVEANSWPPASLSTPQRHELRTERFIASNANANLQGIDERIKVVEENLQAADREVREAEAQYLGDKIEHYLTGKMPPTLDRNKLYLEHLYGRHGIMGTGSIGIEQGVQRFNVLREWARSAARVIRPGTALEPSVDQIASHVEARLGVEPTLLPVQQVTPLQIYISLKPTSKREAAFRQAKEILSTEQTELMNWERAYVSTCVLDLIHNRSSRFEVGNELWVRYEACRLSPEARSEHVRRLDQLAEHLTDELYPYLDPHQTRIRRRNEWSGHNPLSDKLKTFLDSGFFRLPSSLLDAAELILPRGEGDTPHATEFLKELRPTAAKLETGYLLTKAEGESTDVIRLRLKGHYEMYLNPEKVKDSFARLDWDALYLQLSVKIENHIITLPSSDLTTPDRALTELEIQYLITRMMSKPASPINNELKKRYQRHFDAEEVQKNMKQMDQTAITLIKSGKGHAKG